MKHISNQDYLLNTQYKDAGNLNARIDLHARFSTNTYGWMHWVFDQFATARWPATGHILELGCGSGELWRVNAARIEPGWTVTLSDFSPGMLEKARANLAARPTFHFERIDAQHIPYPDASLDVVIANHMLYHVPDRPAALQEIRRVLKPDGQFFASTVGMTHLHELRTLVCEFYPGTESWWVGDKRFALESGAAQLAPYFDHVALQSYEDALDVTEAEPLVAYIASTVDEAALNPGPLTDFINQKLAANGGHIIISKSTGMFCCT